MTLNDIVYLIHSMEWMNRCCLIWPLEIFQSVSSVGHIHTSYTDVMYSSFTARSKMVNRFDVKYATCRGSFVNYHGSNATQFLMVFVMLF